MLKSELILRRLQRQGNHIKPLILPTNAHYLNIASELIRLLQDYKEKRREDLHDAFREYEGDSLDYPIIRGLAAVLEKRCTFGSHPPINPSELRTALFNQGPLIPCSYPQLGNEKRVSREQVVAEAVATYGLPSEQEVESALFADLPQEQMLLNTGDMITPLDLIARYNMEVARGVLYWAREVRIHVKDTYKDIFKYIKLFRLMHTVYPAESSGYDILLHGPISRFVKSTIRYGLQFAKFLPALLLCQNWHMEADIRIPGSRHPSRYILDQNTELKTHFKTSGIFDSQLEADFATEFEEKYGGAKRIWELSREDEIIPLGDTVMIPDFSLTHQKDQRRVLIEIIGFWNPKYLRRKLRKVRQAGRKDLILLIYESANVAEGVFEKASASEVLVFKRKPVLKKVIEAAERCAI